jgi:hypothetical protein
MMMQLSFGPLDLTNQTHQAPPDKIRTHNQCTYHLDGYDHRWKIYQDSDHRTKDHQEEVLAHQEEDSLEVVHMEEDHQEGDISEDLCHLYQCPQHPEISEEEMTSWLGTPLPYLQGIGPRPKNSSHNGKYMKGSTS